MSRQRTIPTPTITSEQADRLNDAGRKIAKAASVLGQALVLAYTVPRASALATDHKPATCDGSQVHTTG